MSERDKIRKELNEYYARWLAGGSGEAAFDAIDEILKRFPGEIEFFIDKFHAEKDPAEKEVLAEIVLRRKHYRPAIDFLKREMGWDDFSGFAGFPGGPAADS